MENNDRSWTEFTDWRKCRPQVLPYINWDAYFRDDCPYKSRFGVSWKSYNQRRRSSADFDLIANFRNYADEILTFFLWVLLGDASLLPHENVSVTGSILRSGSGRHFCNSFVLRGRLLNLIALIDNFRRCLLRSLHFSHSEKKNLSGYSDTKYSSLAGCRYWR